MSQKEKPRLIETTDITIGKLLRYLRCEGGLSLRDLAPLTTFSPSHLSGIEVGRTRISDQILDAYEKHLGFEAYEIRAFFVLLRAEVITIDSLSAGVSPVDLKNAVKIAESLDGFPLLLEPVAVFIEQCQCGLLGYLKLYKPLIDDELKRHKRPSLVKLRLRALLKNQPEGDA